MVKLGTGRTWCARAVGGAVFLAALAQAATADAGGLFFSDRGVRPLGRGGAFVAGADDLGAIWYNPAGIVDAPHQVLADMSFLLFHSKYTRVARVRQLDPNTGEPTGRAWNQTYPTSEGTAPIIPIPTLAVSHDFGLEGASFAIGMHAPYAAGARYQAKVAGQPNPGRYMLINLDGSLLATPGVWGGYRVAKWLQVGAGFELLMGTYRSQLMMSTCLPDRFVCAEEQPDFDSVSQLEVGPIYSPSGNFGVTVLPHENVRIGLSYQLPFRIDAPGTVQVRVPPNAFFDEAYQDGDKARVKMNLPWIARVGVEGRFERFRAELAYVYEAWSMHDKIEITPDNIVLRDVAMFPAEYRITPQVVPRNFKDTSSWRLGGEGWFDVEGYRVDVRGGVMFEKSAIPEEYLSTLTIDLDKVIVGIGSSLHIGDTWRFDAMFARVMGKSQDVSVDPTDPHAAAYPLLNPVRATPATYPDYVNGGKYEASANIIGVGLAANYL